MITALAPTIVDLAHEARFELGAMEVRPSTREVSAGDLRQVLEPRIMQVLVVLASRRGEVVSRQDLIASCWGGRLVGEEAINRCIAAIRRLAETGGGFSITTIARVGYRLDEAFSSSRAAAPDRKVAICVLPFVNMSGDAEQEYFSDGITEDIITDLSKVSALFVVARNTAFTFKGQAVNLADVARQLNISHVLEGSVRKAEDHVRISAQLIDGATGGHVWAERYDRDFGDIFALQDEISHAIVRALQLQLLPEEKTAIERRGTTSPDAYNLILMARRRSLGGNQDLAAAEAILNLCRRATEIDPKFARAWAMVGRFQRILRFAFGKPGDDGLAAVERALELDPGLVEAYAEKASHLFRNGRHDEAFAQIERALRLAPDSWEANACAAELSKRLRRYADAIGYYEKVITLTETSIGNFAGLTELYNLIGDSDGVRRTARTALVRAEDALAQDPSNGVAMACGVHALAALGEEERARDWIRRGLLIDPENRMMQRWFAAALFTYLNDRESALDMLTKGLENSTRWTLDSLEWELHWDRMRDDPRYLAIVATAEARLATAEGFESPATP